MVNISYYNSLLGKIMMASDGEFLIGLWFLGQKNFGSTIDDNFKQNEDSILIAAKKWLDCYFSGQKPNVIPKVYLHGTSFQCLVWNELVKIPYGKTVSYGDIASAIAVKRGKKHVAARAVGSAVGKNPISIIVPCHRVVGADGSLTGYAGGIERKAALLELEKNRLYQNN